MRWSFDLRLPMMRVVIAENVQCGWALHIADCMVAKMSLQTAVVPRYATYHRSGSSSALCCERGPLAHTALFDTGRWEPKVQPRRTYQLRFRP